MKCPLATLAGGDYLGRAKEKQSLRDQIRSRGTPTIPEAPRDVQVQPAAGGVFVTWKLPIKHDQVAGWRLYLNTESNLAVHVRDKGTRQQFIPLSSGTDPAAVNVIVSSVTTLGRESGKVIVRGKPTAQVATTTVPSVPPGYAEEGPGGIDKKLVRFKGETQYTR